MEQDPAETTVGDACVRRGWLVAASIGDMEGRVHGGCPTSAISPFFTGSPSLELMQSLSSNEASSSFLDNIETCLNLLASELVADNTLRPGKYLASAKQLKLLLRRQQQLPPDLASRDIHDRARTLLDTAMSSLAMEFCHLRIWRIDALRDHLAGISPAFIWESVRRSCSSGSSTSDSAASWQSSSAGSFAGASGSSNDGSFNAYHRALSEDMSVRSDKSFSGMNFIDSKSLSFLNDIAGVMIEGGYEHMLRIAIDRHCAQLASYVDILDINNILGGHMEESNEILLKVWTWAMHIIVGVLSEMQRQLNGHDLGSFNTLKEDYFFAIAKVYVMGLLNSTRCICIQEGPPTDLCYKDTYGAVKPDRSKMVNVVMMYQALNYAMRTISALFSGQTKDVILAEGEGIINGLSHMFVKLFVELKDPERFQRLLITDTGVHRATKHIMADVQVLVQQRNTIYLMLKGDLNAIGELVTQMISSLEFKLEMNSRSLQLQGQQQMFLLNNVHFMLEEAKKCTDLGLILGEGWFLKRHDQLDQLMTGYVDASWTPVMSSFERRTQVLEILWPHQLLVKFTSSFEMIYRVQKNWKVTDPLLRQKVRKAICQKVVPLYRMHMENGLEKKHKSARYSIEQLESQLQELFEG